MHLPDRLYNDMVRHAKEAAPEECCGFIAFDVDGPYLTLRATNVAAKPEETFEVSEDEHSKVVTMLAGGGLHIGAVYHSHPEWIAFPSKEDILLSYPETVMIIVGLQEPGVDVRAYHARDSHVTRVLLEIW